MTVQQTFLGKPVLGTISTFDRLIFKGHLAGMRYPAAVYSTLASLGLVLLNDWKAIVEPLTAEIGNYLEMWCRREGRPFEYLQSAHTHRSGVSKEDIARQIAREMNITEGLVCILRVVEPGSSFDLRGNRATHKMEIVRRNRRCLHYYVYYIDPDFGWMHIRIQAWLPFTIQVYVNGREWLCRQLDKRGVAYRRSDNKITAVSDMRAVTSATRRLERISWIKVLDKWAKMVNPLLPKLNKASQQEGYYWVTDQAEYATDILFKNRRDVDELMPDLRRHAHATLSVRDCFRFIGKRESITEAKIDLKQRSEGWRIKFKVGRNSIKIYDHANIIRFETTINHAQAFRVVRHADTAHRADNTQARGTVTKQRKTPLRKGVADFWLLARIAGECNQRMIAACDSIRTTQATIDHLDSLARPKTAHKRCIPRINALSPETIDLFKAIADGANCLNHFNNGDIQKHLYGEPTADPKEQRRRTCRVTRKIACLRGHGLIAKIPGANRYRMTPRGKEIVHAILRFRELDYPANAAA